jgi:hypothetical protein
LFQIRARRKDCYSAKGIEVEQVGVAGDDRIRSAMHRNFKELVVFRVAAGADGSVDTECNFELFSRTPPPAVAGGCGKIPIERDELTWTSSSRVRLTRDGCLCCLQQRFAWALTLERRSHSRRLTSRWYRGPPVPHGHHSARISAKKLLSHAIRFCLSISARLFRKTIEFLDRRVPGGSSRIPLPKRARPRPARGVECARVPVVRLVEDGGKVLLGVGCGDG